MTNLVKVKMIVESRDGTGRPYWSTADGLLCVDQIESIKPSAGMQIAYEGFVSVVEVRTISGDTVLLAGHVSEIQKLLIVQDKQP